MACKQEDLAMGRSSKKQWFYCPIFLNCFKTFRNVTSIVMARERWAWEYNTMLYLDKAFFDNINNVLGYSGSNSKQKNFFLHWGLIDIKWLHLKEIFHLKATSRASLVAQWLRICLPTQGTRVRVLVWEDPTCRGATRPVSHNYWACASGACAPQPERPQ